MRFVLPLAVLGLLLAGCSSIDAPELPRFLRGDGASDAAVAPTPGAPTGPETTTQRREADALFARAKALQDPGERASIYGDIADDYPGHPRAAEARFLQGRSFYEDAEWASAISTFKQYMTDAPVNPHLRQVEEMMYRSGLNYIAADRGILTPFKDDGTGLEALRFIPVVFPAGQYADDAILYLARHFRDDGDLQRASLYYKELLQRYPDSEWSFEARRELGGTYAARDVGGVYHAGFVDRDPREAVPSEDPKAAAFAGPVKSSLEMALEEYDKYLERIARDPGRRAEYAQRVAAVEAEKARVRAQLAEKDERVAAWYADQGDARAAEVYRRSAARWRGATNTPVLPDVRPPPTVAAPAPTTTPTATPTPARPATPTPTPTPAPAPRVAAPTAPPLPPRPAPPSTIPTVRPPAPTAPIPGVPTNSPRVPPRPPPPAWPPR